MPRIVRSARGELVDFDLLKMKYDAEQTAAKKLQKSSTVLARDENFLNAKIAAAQSKKALTEAMAKTEVPATPAQEEVAVPVPAQEPVRKIKREPVKNA